MYQHKYLVAWVVLSADSISWSALLTHTVFMEKYGQYSIWSRGVEPEVDEEKSREERLCSGPSIQDQLQSLWYELPGISLSSASEGGGLKQQH